MYDKIRKDIIERNLLYWRWRFNTGKDIAEVFIKDWDKVQELNKEFDRITSEQ